MRRIGIAITSLLLVGSLATPAMAIRFISGGADVVDGNLRVGDPTSIQPIHGGLYVTFVEVGLGSNEGTNYLVTADASATYGCINKGGKNPSASNKETFSGPVGASAIFTSDKNGRVSGAIIVAPLEATGFSCPSGQTLELICASYTNVVIYDTTNGISLSIPGTFSRCFF